MSNFKCSKCGMINIDCGLGEFKTPREIELEKRIKDLEIEIDCSNIVITALKNKIQNLKKDICNNCSWYGTDNCNPSGMVCEELIKILDIINKAKGE